MIKYSSSGLQTAMSAKCKTQLWRNIETNQALLYLDTDPSSVLTELNKTLQSSGIFLFFHLFIRGSKYSSFNYCGFI